MGEAGDVADGGVGDGEDGGRAAADAGADVGEEAKSDVNASGVILTEASQPLLSHIFLRSDLRSSSRLPPAFPVLYISVKRCHNFIEPRNINYPKLLNPFFAQPIDELMRLHPRSRTWSRECLARIEAADGGKIPFVRYGTARRSRLSFPRRLSMRVRVRTEV